MAIMGTFSSFTGARLAIYASQASLNVTGNNIANVNTKGYTRQRMDLVSLHSTGWPEYRNSYQVDIGYGVLCDQVSQLRDPFLDIRYRDENAELGFYDAKQNALNQLSSILDEVAKGDDYFGVVEKQLGDVFKTLENLKQRVGTHEYDDQFRAACYTLTGLLNDAAKRLETVRDNKVNELKQDTKQVNLLLQEIRDLNDEIRTQGICGDSALELRDARNVAIDKLSKYLKIDVKYSNEYIDQYTTVEKLTISLADTQPEIKLIDGIYGTQFMMNETVPKPNPDYDPNLTTSMKYIGKDGKPTDIEREAAPMKNPAAANDPTALPYLKYIYEKATAPGDRAPMMNPDTATNEKQPYLQWDAAKGQYVPTADRTAAAPLVFPGSTAEVYLGADGKVCTNPDDAALMLNPDPETNGIKRYLMKETDANGDVRYVPTADAGKAAKMVAPVDGGALTDPATAAKAEYIKGKGAKVPTDSAFDAAREPNPTYNAKLSSSNKYLDADGNPVDDPRLAEQIPSFSTDDANADKNAFLYQLQPLRDRDGRLMRDKYDQEITEIVDLNDRTLVSGSLQAVREFLTEEGEFSSKYDISVDKDANTKRGVRYYQHVMDSWAQKFAETFNKANQMCPSVIYKMNGDTFVDEEGQPILTANGENIPSDKKLVSKGNSKTFADYSEEELASLQETGQFKTGFAVNSAFKTNAKGEYINSKGEPIRDENGKEITKDTDFTAVPTALDTLRKKGVLKEELKPTEVFETVTDAATNETTFVSKAGNDVLTPREPSDYSDQEMEALLRKGVLKDDYSFYNGGVLFSNRSDGNDPTGITAKNISIAHAWDNGEVRVLNTKKPDYVDPVTGEIQSSTTANDNILHMIDLFNRKMTYEAKDTVGDSAAENFFFKGSFQEMYTAISGTLAADGMVTYARYKNFDLAALDLDNQRISVSGVDLNEEATNMMQFSKSYSAACRLLTTLDSMLDKLINGTAI